MITYEADRHSLPSHNQKERSCINHGANHVIYTVKQRG